MITSLDMYALIGLILVACGVLYFLLARWAWRNYRALFIVMVIAPVAVVFWVSWITRAFPGSQALADRSYVEDLTGKAFWTKVVFEYNSPRDFNGDGYSIVVYELDDEVASALSKPDSLFFQHPLRSDDRNRWEQKRWRRTPLRPEDSRFLEVAIVESEDANPGMAETFKELRDLMAEEGNYYSFNNLMLSAEIVSNVDFYVLSPSHKRLFVINLNT